MATSKQKMTRAESDVRAGTFSRAEAVGHIVGGCRHLYSTPLGVRDPLVLITKSALANKNTPHFPWEPTGKLESITLQDSQRRGSIIRDIESKAGITNTRFLREKMTNILEELISNAFFHAYLDSSGKEKYPRRSPALLQASEKITVRFQLGDRGIYLSVSDQGGSLSFGVLASALRRCYQSDTQLENKESGAGLGTYMIFESATHLKIEVTPNKGSQVACWIADHQSFSAEYFSFNFFERGK
jgi:hypothetical protein